jgi:hypothetical protein
MTVIAGMYCGKITVHFHFDDYTNINNFWFRLEKVVCAELRSKRVAIIENTLFYRSLRVREIIEHASCRLLYLPPYSPGLNPIGHYWA